MMVLVLWVIVLNSSCNFNWSHWKKPFTTESTVVEAVGTLWTAIELGYEIFVRAMLINNKNLFYLCTISSSTKSFLT